jgi:hypothetical protein
MHIFHRWTKWESEVVGEITTPRIDSSDKLIGTIILSKRTCITCNKLQLKYDKIYI